MGELKKSKYSYSKINTYDSCGWRYYLTYKQGHYIFTKNINTEFGTLVHYIEQQIGEALKAHKPVDYDKLKKDFYELNIPKTSKYDTTGDIFGINVIKQHFPEDFFKTDELGHSYATKAEDYLNFGIYRLENWLKDNPDYEVYGLEKFFSITFEGEILSGFIDRILYNKKENTYIIEDIKTKDKPFKDDDLVTPLQFVIYDLALRSIIDDDKAEIKCAYDLPICNMKQDAGTKGFLRRGKEKLQKLFTGINEEDFTPRPTPLCAWCVFSPTNPTQPEAGKNLCPYYSLWTQTNKTHKVAHAWKGMEAHEKLLKELQENNIKTEIGIDFDF